MKTLSTLLYILKYSAHSYGLDALVREYYICLNSELYFRIVKILYGQPSLSAYKHF